VDGVVRLGWSSGLTHEKVHLYDRDIHRRHRHGTYLPLKNDSLLFLCCIYPTAQTFLSVQATSDRRRDA
jgi:hypothetical protein